MSKKNVAYSADLKKAQGLEPLEKSAIQLFESRQHQKAAEKYQRLINDLLALEKSPVKVEPFSQTLANAYIMHARCLVRPDDFLLAFEQARQGFRLHRRTDIYEFLLIKTIDRGFFEQAHTVLVAESKVQEQLKKADSLTEQEKVIQAISLCGSVLLANYGYYDLTWPKIKIKFLKQAISYYLPAYLPLITLYVVAGEFELAEQALIKAKAHKDIETAQVLHAEATWYGFLGNPKGNISKAVALFLQAAALGHAFGWYGAAKLLDNEVQNPDRDVKQIVNHYRLAAEAGVAEAAHDLGWKYLYGEDVEVDEKQAKSFFKIAYNKNHLNSNFYYAFSLILEDPQSNREEAVAVVAKADEITEARYLHLILRLPLHIKKQDNLAFQYDSKMATNQSIKELLPDCNAMLTVLSAEKRSLTAAELSDVMGHMYEQINEFDQAEFYYRLAGESGLRVGYSNLFLLKFKRSEDIIQKKSPDWRPHLEELFKILNRDDQLFGRQFTEKEQKLPPLASLSAVEFVKKKAADLKAARTDLSFQSTFSNAHSSPHRNLKRLAEECRRGVLDHNNFVTYMDSAGKLVQQLCMDSQFLYQQLEVILSAVSKSFILSDLGNWQLLAILRAIGRFSLQFNSDKWAHLLESLLALAQKRLESLGVKEINELLCITRNLYYGNGSVKKFAEHVLNFTLENSTKLINSVDVLSAINLLHSVAVLDNYYQVLNTDILKKILKPCLDRLPKDFMDWQPADAQKLYFALSYFNVSYGEIAPPALLTKLRPYCHKPHETETISKFHQEVSGFTRKYFASSDQVQCRASYDEKRTVTTKSVDSSFEFVVKGSAEDVVVLFEYDGPQHFFHVLPEQKGSPVLKLKELFHTTLMEGAGCKVLRASCYEWDSLTSDEQRYALIQGKFATVKINFPDFEERWTTQVPRSRGQSLSSSSARLNYQDVASPSVDSVAVTLVRK